MKEGSKLYALNDQELLTVIIALRKMETQEAADVAMYLVYMQHAQYNETAIQQVAAGIELEKEKP
jgi:hypothetical protein